MLCVNFFKVVEVIGGGSSFNVHHVFNVSNVQNCQSYMQTRPVSRVNYLLGAIELKYYLGCPGVVP